MNPQVIGKRIGRIATALSVLAAVVSAAAQPVTYRLTHDSSYVVGCFELCSCPLSYSPLAGRFRLTPISITGTYDTYAVTNIHWTVAATGEHIIGGGTYTIFNEFAALNRLELDLMMSGQAVHFDSGMVPVGSNWPYISVTVAEHGEPACYDIRLGVIARPLHADINGDGLVGIDDLLEVINQWGDCPKAPAECVADITPEPVGDRRVDVDDLLLIIANWD
jgi:hypothetical protein